LEGELTINGFKLEKRDGIDISEVKNIDIKTSVKTKVLLMEVPMIIEILG